MSEFTVGILFLTQDQLAVEAALKARPLPHLVSAVNDRWTALFTPDEYLFQPDTRRAVCELSHTAPLLHFYSAEDHGWGFTLFWGGGDRFTYSHSYAHDPIAALFD